MRVMFRSEIKAFFMPDRMCRCGSALAGKSAGIQAKRSRRAIFLTRAAVSIMSLLAFMNFPLTVSAEEIQNLDGIRQSARNFVLNMAKPGGQKVETEAGTLDPRLRLSPCTSKLEAFLPAGAKLSGNTTVGVRCQSSKPWTVYIPVRIRIYGQVVVTSRPVAKGATLQEADIRLETRDMAALTVTPLTDRNQALGKLTRRPLETGTVIAANELQAVRLVRRGEKVTILASSGGLEVRANGEALVDGVKGDQIRVRNTLTNIVIQATVTGPGVVQTPL